MIKKNPLYHFTFCIFTLILISVHIQLQAQSNAIDSLKQLMTSKQEPVAKIALQYQLHEAYLKQDLDKARSFLIDGISESEKIGHQGLLLKGLNFYSDFLLIRGEVDSVLIITTKAIELDYKADSSEWFTCLLNHGRAMHMDSKNDQAVEWLLKSLDWAESMDSPTMLMSAMTNLGNVYWSLGDNDKALSYFQNSLEIGDEDQFLSQRASNLGNIGLIYRENGKVDEALESYLASNKIFEDLGEKLHIAINLQNIGVLYESVESLDTAMHYFQAAHQLNKEIDDKIGVALTTINMAIIEAKTGHYPESLVLLDSALTLSTDINYKPAIKIIYYSYSEVYSRTGEFEKALEARKNFEIWQDSIINENYLNKITELENKYEFEKKQKEILSLSEENLIKEAAIQTKDSWIRFLFFALFFMICTAFLVVLVFRQRTRLQFQKTMFNTIMDTEIREQHRIAKDLHDSIGSMLAVVKNKLSSLKEPEKQHITQEISDTEVLVSKTAEETRRIAHNMMPEDLMKFGLVTATESLMDHLGETADIKMECAHFGMEERIDSSKEINIYRILQEIIQNSLKHSGAKHINLHFTRHNGNLNIIIEDDGKGFDTVKTGAGGMGLKNIQSRIDYLGASWNLESTPEKGTTVIMDIPTTS